MPPSPKDESPDSLDQLLSSATRQSASAGFANKVIDAAYTERQVDGSPQIVRFLAPTLAAAAGIAITLLITERQESSNTLAPDGNIVETAPDAEVIITELDSINILLALESSLDVSLVEDDELDTLLF